MSLAARRSTRQREDFVIRLGCLLVSFAVLASLVLEPPKAKAFALTSSAVTALAGSFLNACGLAPVVSGMSSSGEVNESLARLIQDFLDEEHPGLKDAVDWIGDAVLTVNGGRVIIPSETAKRLSAFATWVAGKYGTKAGENQVYGEAESYFTLADGSKFLLSSFDKNGNPISIGSSFSLLSDLPLYFSTGYYLAPYSYVDRPFSFAIYDSDGSVAGSGNAYYPLKQSGIVYFGSGYWGTSLGYHLFLKEAGKTDYRIFVSFETRSVEKYFGYIVDVDKSLSLDVAEAITIPEGLMDNQSVALDVGATDSMSIQEILQGILDAILAGDLSASAEIVDEAVEPVDPPAGELPDVDGLGLPALGAALTSRFPFSIPWDVYKGVTLLAAPPKAPYFEVDFMAPIADRVGGWQGSTKIVLDFSEYEIIGQVCRWTSTIGFCLMLATGTKRLIWTA